jgi:hypothetical protein
VSLHKPLYAKFRYKDVSLEGEYIPMWTDYFSPEGCDNNPLTEPGLGFIRSFDRDLRQSILYANMNRLDWDYEDWMNLGDVVQCDAFVTGKDNYHADHPLLIDDFKIVSREELTTNQEEIDLCRKDILERMIIITKNMKDGDQELLKQLEEIFYNLNIENYAPPRYRRKFSGFFKGLKRISYVIGFFVFFGTIFLTVIESKSG